MMAEEPALSQVKLGDGAIYQRPMSVLVLIRGQTSAIAASRRRVLGRNSRNPIKLEKGMHWRCTRNRSAPDLPKVSDPPMRPKDTNPVKPHREVTINLT